MAHEPCPLHLNKICSICQTIDNRQNVTYASETSTLTKRDRKQLNISERKVFRRILVPVYDNEKENWLDIN
jgi:hypothetical protein